ncbi:hypothetical protein IMG5_094280 [Ichthyophthirius multifiliis]|uniref:Uncharacterized protein n=1 Tax=Ichthyophthirius multifiliis TaxID=5932 RepID=G0QRJ7_ICHMU|nr:hypothetical protein IMG5_094280 [Ichthyophthirius multifiliis]EGR32165.1 hypothetical protein IMG5_094280 [Ichthyophthirius multifiliis]|eukprot:XP_004035651.1 hypothetical protein IMG5_094280 [Ichthyophthirius multifiliis]
MKKTKDRDEKIEAGLNSSDDLDAELEEIIENKVEFNEKNEFLAKERFVQDIVSKEREEIKGIIKGICNGYQGKKRNLQNLNNDLNESESSFEERRKQRIIRAFEEIQEKEKLTQFYVKFKKEK